MTFFIQRKPDNLWEDRIDDLYLKNTKPSNVFYLKENHAMI
jgi:hypothetical protein